VLSKSGVIYAYPSGRTISIGKTAVLSPLAVYKDGVVIVNAIGEVLLATFDNQIQSL